MTMGLCERALSWLFDRILGTDYGIYGATCCLRCDTPLVDGRLAVFCPKCDRSAATDDARDRAKRRNLLWYV